jgi:biopolymer transport protein ExbD
MGFRNRRSRQEEEAEINVTPMLDVVFIMLIFFIVTASFVKETGIEVERPEAMTAEPKQQGNILVAISGNNDIWIQKKRLDIRQVRPTIEGILAENPQASVIIQADSGSKNGLFIEVMDQAKQAGVKDVAIAALPIGP